MVKIVVNGSQVEDDDAFGAALEDELRKMDSPVVKDAPTFQPSTSEGNVRNAPIKSPDDDSFAAGFEEAVKKRPDFDEEKINEKMTELETKKRKRLAKSGLNVLIGLGEAVSPDKEKQWEEDLEPGKVGLRSFLDEGTWGFSELVMNQIEAFRKGGMTLDDAIKAAKRLTFTDPITVLKDSKGLSQESLRLARESREDDISEHPDADLGARVAADLVPWSAGSKGAKLIAQGVEKGAEITGKGIKLLTSPSKHMNPTAPLCF